MGVLVSYGNEPHTTRLIQDDAGVLYLPDPSRAAELDSLAPGTYEWLGRLKEPKPGVPGIVPPHKGILMDLEWRRLGD